MRDILVTKKTAKLAKKKGFRGQTVLYFDTKTGEKCRSTTELDWNLNHLALPSQALVQRWLREEHKIYVTVTTNVETLKCGYEIFQHLAPDHLIISTYHDDESKWDMEYDEALELGLTEALKLIEL